MSDLPEAKWFCDNGDASGFEPMAVPIYEGNNSWYVEGVGHVDNQNRMLFGGQPRNPFGILNSVDEIVAWRKVADHLNNGGDIMDIKVPHEDGHEPVADGIIWSKPLGSDFLKDFVRGMQAGNTAEETDASKIDAEHINRWPGSFMHDVYEERVEAARVRMRDIARTMPDVSASINTLQDVPEAEREAALEDVKNFIAGRLVEYDAVVVELHAPVPSKLTDRELDQSSPYVSGSFPEEGQYFKGTQPNVNASDSDFQLAVVGHEVDPDVIAGSIEANLEVVRAALEAARAEEAELPDVTVGQPLPGLKQYRDLPEGVEYWDQVITTKYGNFEYGPFQLRNGTILWTEVDDGSKETLASLLVQAGSGIVVSFSPGVNNTHEGDSHDPES